MRDEILPQTIFDFFLFFWGGGGQAGITCPGFQEYHKRLQTFLMWFIETASFIDSDDDRWDYFLVWVPSWFNITHIHTLKPLLCHWKTKALLLALVTNYQASLIIFPSQENCWSGKIFLCAQKPFSDFSGASAELNTVVFWNSEQCGNSKKSFCRCFLYPGNY